MHYIVMDLEWNQPMSYDGAVFRKVGDRLVFEMIQIGAVKVDESYQVVDSISIPIRPQYYIKIHPRISKMTQLSAETLADAPTFLDAMAQFTAWCGDDYTLLTWGCDDISVLKQNMDFFGYTEQLPPICDIQRLFSDVHGCRDRKGLKTAMEMVSIEQDAARYFHNALHDAYYTALVFASLPKPEDVLKYPQKPRMLCHADKRERAGGETFDTVQEAFESDFARVPRCPVCGKKMKAEQDGYVRQTADKYMMLAACPQHGNMLVRARLRLESDGKKRLMMSASKASPSNVAYVHTKRLQMRQRDEEYLVKHGAPVDLEYALENAERTSMPFED